MFGKKKNNGASNITPGAINIIGAGTAIIGDVKAGNNIRIDGMLEGNLHTEAKLILGAKGKIKGDVWCTTAEISGRIEGNIYVREMLSLTSTAVIAGNITTVRLKIAEGAQYNGTCMMGEKKVASHFEVKRNEKTTASRAKVVA